MVEQNVVIYNHILLPSGPFQTYVTNLNNFCTSKPELGKKTLEEIVMESEGPVFNNAAQV